MKISKELVDKLKETYNVFYNDCLNAWTRSQGKWNRKDFDLGKVTELITGDNILTKGNSYVDFVEYTVDGDICICGCPFCTKLYMLYHIKTGICFLVGSKCIEKAGHDNFIKDSICAKKNGVCEECKVPLIFKGTRQNSTKKLADLKRVCKACRKHERHYLNISYAHKDVYKKYDTKWDADNKMWYWKGYIDEIPDVLISKRK